VRVEARDRSERLQPERLDVVPMFDRHVELIDHERETEAAEDAYEQRDDDVPCRVR
jgi:hypothetical protein